MDFAAKPLFKYKPKKGETTMAMDATKRFSMEQRGMDTFEFSTGDENALREEIEIMEDNTEWIENLQSNGFTVTEIENPMEAEELSEEYGIPADYLRDICEQEGTHLIAHNDGKSWPIAATAIGTLGETAKLYGAAFERMTHTLRAQTYSNGLTTARGRSLVPVRFGRAAAFHSWGEKSGYLIMPQTMLFDDTVACLQNKFGKIQFSEGIIRHDFTRACWELPEAQERLLDKYREILMGKKSLYDISKMMPCARFSTSDTAKYAATLQPEFKMKSGSFCYIRFGNAISVRHEKHRDGLEGIDLYDKEIEQIWAKFDESIEQIQKLTEIPIYNGANCVVSLCNRYNISKRYGDQARQEISDYQEAGAVITAHDVYLSICNAVGEARWIGVSPKVIENLEENVSRILSAEFSEHDVGGVVAWKSAAKAA